MDVTIVIIYQYNRNHNHDDNCVERIMVYSKNYGLEVKRWIIKFSGHLVQSIIQCLSSACDKWSMESLDIIQATPPSRRLLA